MSTSATAHWSHDAILRKVGQHLQPGITIAPCTVRFRRHDHQQRQLDGIPPLRCDTAETHGGHGPPQSPHHRIQAWLDLGPAWPADRGPVCLLRIGRGGCQGKRANIRARDTARNDAASRTGANRLASTTRGYRGRRFSIARRVSCRVVRVRRRRADLHRSGGGRRNFDRTVSARRLLWRRERFGGSVHSTTSRAIRSFTPTATRPRTARCSNWRIRSSTDGRRSQTAARWTPGTLPRYRPGCQLAPAGRCCAVNDQPTAQRL